MKHSIALAFAAAFFAACGPNLTADAFAAPVAAALKPPLGAEGTVDRGAPIRRVDGCKRRRFYNPGVFLDGGLDHLDPNYGEMNHGECLDPPPRRSDRLSCREVREILLERGYRRIRSRDCKGTVYGFHANRGSKRYKLRVRSRNGTIASRKRL